MCIFSPRRVEPSGLARCSLALTLALGQRRVRVAARLALLRRLLADVALVLRLGLLAGGLELALAQGERALRARLAHLFGRAADVVRPVRGLGLGLECNEVAVHEFGGKADQKLAALLDGGEAQLQPGPNCGNFSNIEVQSYRHIERCWKLLTLRAPVEKRDHRATRGHQKWRLNLRLGSSKRGIRYSNNAIVI